jgi:diphthine synthase
VIKENKERGLHTLVLLDIDREKGRYMTIGEGIDILLKMEEKTKYNLINEDTLICGVARAGSNNPVVRAGTLRIIKNIDFGPPLHTIVIPGNLHFVEERALEVFAGLKR